jgi:hypothetical protein
MSRSSLVTNRVAAGTHCIEDASLTTGTRFFVHHSGANATTRGLTPDDPLATLDYAIGLCTANKNDVIYLMPGHAETLSSAAYILADVAGISIIGLGNGTNRPTFTWAATAATISITANDVLIRNIRCTCSIDEVVTLISVTGTDCTLDKVDYAETSSFQAIQFLLTTNAADRICVKNCYHAQGTAPAANSKWIQLVGVDDCRILDNYFHLTLSNNAASVTISGSTALVRGQIARNTIVQLGGTNQVSGILLVDSSTTFVHDNRVAVGSTALAGGTDVGNAGYAAENYTLNTPDASGILDPVADS